jgi:hypothetical protein
MSAGVNKQRNAPVGTEVKEELDSIMNHNIEDVLATVVHTCNSVKHTMKPAFESL